MMLVDTSALLAAMFPDQRGHKECGEVLSKSRGPLMLSSAILAELDYLITKLATVTEELRFLGDVASGAYELAPIGAEDIARAREIIEQYLDLGIGLADASIVVLSEKYDVLDLLTLDERHFRALRGARGRPFRILPADA